MFFYLEPAKNGLPFPSKFRQKKTPFSSKFSQKKKKKEN